MAVKGQIAQFSYGDRNDVYSENHPKVVLDVLLPEGMGSLERGTVIGVDGSGDFVVYDPSNSEHKPYGVLIEDYDPQKSTSAKVLVMGVVYKDAVKVNGAEPSNADIEALRGLNIYVINRA